MRNIVVPEARHARGLAVSSRQIVAYDGKTFEGRLIGTWRDQCILCEFEGLDALIGWFGERPCFHDSEVLAVKLVRDGPSQIFIHAWNTLDQVDSNGLYVLDRHTVGEISFQRVTDVSLSCFGQNVISWLQVEKRDNKIYRLILEECIGVYGFVEGEQLSVGLKPITAPKGP